MTYKNFVKDRVQTGETVLGASTLTNSPILIETYADLGFDYVWLDHEHIGEPSSDARHFELIRRITQANNIEPIVRLESNNPSTIRKVLDSGIRTIVIPRVKTAEEVRRAVKAAKFTFNGEVGERGVGASLASNWGDREEEYIKNEDESVFVGVMFENKESISNIDDILSVPELGFGRIGPTDLSVSLGAPLNPTHKKVIAAIENVFEAGQEHEIPIGLSAGLVGGVAETIEMGSKMVTLGNEVKAVKENLGRKLASGKEITL